LIPLGSDITDYSGMKVYLDEYKKRRKEILEEMRGGRSGEE